MSEERAALIREMLSEPRKKFGSEAIPMTADADKFGYLGLPLNELALQYLIQGDIWPLDKLVLVYGDENSCKSAFALWLAGLFVRSGNHAVYCDAEGKFPSDIARSLVAEDLQGCDNFDLVKITSADEAQEAIQEWMRYCREVNADLLAQGMDPYSMVIILDSLAAAISDEEISKLEDKGSGSASMAPYAKKWSVPLTKLATHDLIGSNISFVVINHEKRELSMYGGRTRVGGKAKEYLSFLSIRMRPARGSKSQDTHGGVTRRWIEMSIDKNGMGEMGRKIEVPFLWGPDYGFGFDFDYAAVETLKDNIPNDGYGPLEDISVWGGKYTSKSLGLSRVETDEFMEAVRENEDVMDSIWHTFGIRHRTFFHMPEEGGTEEE